MRIGINGFGRIGKNFLKALLERHPHLEVVAINDLGSAKECAHLFKYDSTYGPYPNEVQSREGSLEIDGRAIKLFSERKPESIPWRDVRADLIIECTGLFTDGAVARRHLDGGARKVIISAPAKNEDLTLCMGVNHHAYQDELHHIISNASCTTNCLAATLSPIVATLGWQRGFMTTVHAYTNDQNVLDAPHKDLRRARSAANNIIPTSSGAAKALYLTIPEVQGSFEGFALRVPTATVSMVYLVAQVLKQTSAEAVGDIIRQAAASADLKGILGFTMDSVVSSDLRRSPMSSIVDMQLTQCQGDLLQLCAWYDNEWGYACRLADAAAHVVAKGQTRS